jgi:hypothetical protein
MNDPDEYLTMAQAARLVPGSVHLATLYRWRRGVRGVRLETELVGGRRYVRRSKLAQFLAASAAAGEALTAMPTPNQNRVAAIRRAETELDRAGIRLPSSNDPADK